MRIPMEQLSPFLSSTKRTPLKTHPPTISHRRSMLIWNSLLEPHWLTTPLPHMSQLTPKVLDICRLSQKRTSKLSKSTTTMNSIPQELVPHSYEAYMLGGV